jgi:dimethyl sulfoxide reductase iron-sulfur subunit
MARYGLVIDLRKCQGCRTCEVSCKMAHTTPKGVSYLKVDTKEIGTYPDTKLEYTHLQCQHCAKAPCVGVCPTGALTKDANNGIVSADSAKCIGCRQCMGACPYDARTFVEKVVPYFVEVAQSPYDRSARAKHEPGKVEACDLCRDRLAGGKEPACVAECPWYARYFGDLSDPKGKVASLIAERKGEQRQQKGTDPSIYYLPKG